MFWVDATTGVAVLVSTLSDGATALVGGTTYKCFAAEISTTTATSGACSSGVDVTAPTLDSPTVSASTGSADGTVTVTATRPSSNLGSSFDLICVAEGQSCPAGAGTSLTGPWFAVASSGTAQTVSKYWDGSSSLDMVDGVVYTCYAAETNAGPVRKCSTGSNATAKSGYYLDANGVTVHCPGVAVGATFTLGSTTYTKRDRAGLDTLVAGTTNVAALATSCTTGVTDMSQLFGTLIASKVSDPSTFNPDLSSWDTSAVTNMQTMFCRAIAFDGNIGSWNTGAVTSMFATFALAAAFNQNIGGWDTSAVTDMRQMFNGASAFNQDIGGWNMGAVTGEMDAMFQNAVAFNQDLSSWTANPASCVDFSAGASAWISQYDGNLSQTTALGTNMGACDATYNYYLDPNGVTVRCKGVAVGATFTLGSTTYTKRDWTGLDALVTGTTDEAALAASCTTGVTDMFQLFGSYTSSKVSNPGSFNPDLSSWDMTAVTNMGGMFAYASGFNQDITKWDTSAVTSMFATFTNAAAFNQNIGAWSTGSVIDMRQMFDGATAFNQDLSGWTVNPNVSSCTNFASGASSWALPQPNFTSCTP